MGRSSPRACRRCGAWTHGPVSRETLDLSTRGQPQSISSPRTPTRQSAALVRA
jgi:hypothetical protein